MGRVAAYSSFPVCLNGNSSWSMVIRVQHPKDIGSQFIRVDFSLPCGKSPEWASGKPSPQKFRLRRERDCDTVLEKFRDFRDEETKHNEAVPIWKYPADAEHDPLPFGQILPCYRSIDLPLIPVV